MLPDKAYERPWLKVKQRNINKIAEHKNTKMVTKKKKSVTLECYLEQRGKVSFVKNKTNRNVSVILTLMQKTKN